MHGQAATFFLQMALILGLCRAVGLLARRLGQPQVVGEMVAGVLLGPSLLGWVFPQFFQAVFPPPSRELLQVGAQLGIGLYMFFVGLEFDLGHFRQRLRSALSVSIAGMIVPFALAALLTPWLLRLPGTFHPELSQFEASLFLGAAVAVTAFPMLARIIAESGIANTRLGTLVLAAGAIDDAVAWCLLAVVLATFGVAEPLIVGNLSLGAHWLAIGGSLLLVLLLIAARPALRWLTRRAEAAPKLSGTWIAVTLALFCLVSWFAERIGIHAILGGFLFGIVMPRGPLATALKQKLEPFVLLFLLPMFFTFSGLNTRLSVLLEPQLLLAAAAVLAVSILGKGVACWAAARTSGEDQPTALAIGTLMNARGMMELVILNIGLQRGLIGESLFSMLVLMAIVTTLMTSPLFEWIARRQRRQQPHWPRSGPGEDLPADIETTPACPAPPPAPPLSP